MKSPAEILVMETKEQLFRVTFNIPTTYNDGVKIPAKIAAKAMLRIGRMAKGYSMINGVMGAWWSDQIGKMLLDKNRLIWVFIPEQKVEPMRELVREIGRELRQEAMYFEVTPVDVEFIDCIGERSQ